MISVSGRKWQEKKINFRLVEKLQQEHNFSRITSQLVISRNFDEDEIHLIDNELKLANIFQNNPDFIKSTQLVERTIKNGGKICILGDYDVDGSAATSLLINFLKKLDHPFTYYIPDRIKDGYGASTKLFRKLVSDKPKLIIMVDCGSTSIDAIDYLNKKKINSLIIDHHEINKPYPKANVIINPKKDNGYLEYDYLCATALTYFFLDKLSLQMNIKLDLRKYLIYVLLATVCDVMPLRKLNRLISIIALREFKINNNYAFKELYNLSKKKNKISISDLGYFIGPILNSGGRLGKSNYATELLTTNNTKKIHKNLSALINLNEKRKKIESTILENLDFDKIEKKKENIVVHYDPNINEGLIGIIAARLKDYFNKPSIVITKSNNILKGSARSINNYHIGKAIKRLLEKNIILKGGGHNMAAGFSLEKKNLNNFKEFFINDSLKINKLMNNEFTYESEISSLAFNKDFYKEIKKIEPFGNGNPEPVFLFNDLKVIKLLKLKKNYISCILKSNNGVSINSIYFNSTNNNVRSHLINFKKKFSVIGQINENFWNNKKSLQLIIKDLIL